MTNTHCYACGILFGMPDDYYTNRVRDHKQFWCPNGHSQSFVGETEEEKYKRLYERANSESVDIRVRLEAVERSKERAEQALRNHKKRAAAGVCPCCTRTVSQLAKHMQAKHPLYVELAGLKPVKLLAEKVQ